MPDPFNKVSSGADTTDGEGRNFIDPSCSIGKALQPPSVFDMDRACTTRGCWAVCSETAVIDLSTASAVMRPCQTCMCACAGAGVCHSACTHVYDI